MLLIIIWFNFIEYQNLIYNDNDLDGYVWKLTSDSCAIL